MTRKRESEPLQKVTLNLFDGDFGKLQELYPKIGAAAAIRRLVRRHLMEVEHKLSEIKE